MGSSRQVVRGAIGPLLALAGSLVLFELTPVDLRLQDVFFDFESGRWIVDRDNVVGRALFYVGPKWVIYAIGVATIAVLVGPARWRTACGLSRKALTAALVTLAVVPALAGLGKRTLNVFCPSEIARYGGDVPYVKLFERYAPGDRPARRGGCFPAGHASGGFALMGFAALRSERRWRRAVIATAIVVGWWMGLYQMLKGAHYLSHTVTTMLLAWLVASMSGIVSGAAYPAGECEPGSDGRHASAEH